MKSFKRKKTITDIKEIDFLVSRLKYYGLEPICIGRNCKYKTLNEYKAKFNNDTYLSKYMIFELKETKLEITTSYGRDLVPCTYIFDLNEDPSIVLSGQKCFAEFSKYFKMPKCSTYNNEEINNMLDDTTGKYVSSASPILDYNPKYENTVLKDCYEYDLNSAYFNTLLNKVPDLNNPIFYSKVKNNQVGFIFDDQLSMVKSGWADIIFNLIDTPEGIKKYCDIWYNRKKEAKEANDIINKIKAKAYLNLPIGYSQRYNPFLRAYVVHSCNELIRSLIDENTLFWNTDAIFSKTKRTDLKIGNNIGDFKEEKCDELRYRGNTYQINKDIPIYRGIPKAWFIAFEKKNGRHFDLLTDNVPSICNRYEWDWNTMKLVEQKYE